MVNFPELVSRSKRAACGAFLISAKQITEAHGGVITVDSEPGQGATFTITLPLHYDGAHKDGYHTCYQQSNPQKPMKSHE